MIPNFWIVLKNETQWRKPIQVYDHCYLNNGKKKVRHRFSEYETFEDAIYFLRFNHNCSIVIDRQIGIGMFQV